MTPVILLALALAAPVPKELANPRDYFPTAIGSKWEYVTTGVGKEQPHTEEITAAVVTKAGLRVTFKRTRPNAKDFETVYVVGEKDIALTKSGPFDYDPPLPTLKKGMKAGDNWETETVFGTGAKPTTYQFKVGEAAEVKVPAGTFTAFPVTRKQKGSKLDGYTFWYAPNVGLVKTDLVGGAGTVLTKFTPGKAEK